MQQIAPEPARNCTVMSAEPEPGGFDAFLVPREFGAVFRLSGSQIPLMPPPYSKGGPSLLGWRLEPPPLLVTRQAVPP